jgi:hypothetical protein
MKRSPSTIVAIAIAMPAGAVLAGSAAADVVFENARFRATLGQDAVWRSLVDKATGKDYCAADKRVTFACARVEGKTRPADRASLAGGRLTVGLAGCNTQLVYQVSTTDDWIAWKLVEVKGTRPTHLTLVRIGVTITDRVGPRLGGAWNDRYAICLRGANLQTDGRAAPRHGYAELATSTQDFPGPKLEGACAALLAAPSAERRCRSAAGGPRWPLPTSSRTRCVRCWPRPDSRPTNRIPAKAALPGSSEWRVVGIV